MNVVIAVLVIIAAVCGALAITGALLLAMFGDVIIAKLGK